MVVLLDKLSHSNVDVEFVRVWVGEVGGTQFVDLLGAEFEILLLGND